MPLPSRDSTERLLDLEELFYQLFLLGSRVYILLIFFIDLRPFRRWQVMISLGVASLLSLGVVALSTSVCVVYLLTFEFGIGTFVLPSDFMNFTATLVAFYFRKWLIMSSSCWKQIRRTCFRLPKTILSVHYRLNDIIIFIFKLYY